MSWSEDRQRLKEMGPGLVSFCALLLILAALGAASLSIFARNENYLAAAYGADSYMVQTYWIAAAKLLVQTALLLASALALFFTSSRIAVFITVFALLFAGRSAFQKLALASIEANSEPLSIFNMFDIAIIGSMIAYLLASKQIEQIYGIGTRKFLTRGIANIWQRARGRPTLEEAEAMRFEETFK